MDKLTYNPNTFVASSIMNKVNSIHITRESRYICNFFLFAFSILAAKSKHFAFHPEKFSMSF